MPNTPPKIILASTSPRRTEILKLLGLPFEVQAPLYEEESLDEWSPYEEALRFSIEKARSLAHAHPDALVIGSDTLLEFEGGKIGKPRDLGHARQILASLKGKPHDILTGACVLDARSGQSRTSVEIIQVQMREYCESEIEAYVEADQPLDKAGAYALQGRGRFLIESLKGDYLAAVGFPLRFVAESLQAFGVDLPRSIEEIYSEKNFMNWKSY